MEKSAAVEVGTSGRGRDFAEIAAEAGFRPATQEHGAETEVWNKRIGQVAGQFLAFTRKPAIQSG